MSINTVDVRIDLESKKFKYRVAGIIEDDGKLLVVRMRQNPFYCFPGGHVELLEDTQTAVKRELEEELYFKVDVQKLLYIHENFFKAENKDFHELCFYFKCTPIDKNLKKEKILWHEIDKGEELTHEYVWIDKKEILKEHVEPKEVLQQYLKNSEEFLHFITRN
jgi:ADP-ribose pyrophosphatase YjhB (NUDIX family)